MLLARPAVFHSRLCLLLPLVLTLSTLVILRPRLSQAPNAGEGRAQHPNLRFVSALCSAGFHTSALRLSEFLSLPRVTGHESQVTAHEWGTFTSIAGPDGAAMEWLPLSGSTDLPPFVDHLQNADFKGGLTGTIRMETPVLYFYSPQEATVSVHASFSKGLITEWYPHASVPALNPRRDLSLEQKHTEGAITWNSVEIRPSSGDDFPTGPSFSHYYAARQTASAPLTIESSAGAQHEKFLFYRGVSAVFPPLTVTLSPDGTVLLENHLSVVSSSDGKLKHSGVGASAPTLAATTGKGLQPLRNWFSAPENSAAKVRQFEDSANEIPNAVLFERRGSSIGYRILGPLQTQASFAPPALDGSLDSPFSDLEGMLIKQGLYADEAHAMLETWKDSWFDDGSRVLYIVPRSFVDSVLPLTIAPAPQQVTRVFVGRLELITPATQQAVEAAFASNDHDTLARYGRFLDPILRSMLESATDRATRDRLTSYLNSAYSSFYSQSLD